MTEWCGTGAALANCESRNFSEFSDVRKTQHFFSEMFFGHCSDTLSTRGNTVVTTRSCENYHDSSKRTSENPEKLPDSQFPSAGTAVATAVRTAVGTAVFYSSDHQMNARVIFQVNNILTRQIATRQGRICYYKEYSNRMLGLRHLEYPPRRDGR